MADPVTTVQTYGGKTLAALVAGAMLGTGGTYWALSQMHTLEVASLKSTISSREKVVDELNHRIVEQRLQCDSQAKQRTDDSNTNLQQLQAANKECGSERQRLTVLIQDWSKAYAQLQESERANAQRYAQSASALSDRNWLIKRETQLKSQIGNDDRLLANSRARLGELNELCRQSRSGENRFFGGASPERCVDAAALTQSVDGAEKAIGAARKELDAIQSALLK